MTFSQSKLPRIEKAIKVVGIVGPTGSGKSRFAIEVAKRINGEIISCDSMAVYRGVDIATDKVPIEERDGIPHHLYNVVEPPQFFSAGHFKKIALKTIYDISLRGAVPLLVGGTGLYFRTITSGLAEAPERNEELRIRLNKIINKRGIGYLYMILKRVDPVRASEIGEKDKVRIIRAIEVNLLTKKRFNEVIKGRHKREENIEVFKICLYYPRDLLYERINKRVDKMVEMGLLNEAKRLYEEGKLKGPISKAIGLKEFIPLFEGKIGIEEVISQIKKNSRNLAKRQITWFKRENGLKWVLMLSEEEKEIIMKEIILWLKGEEKNERS